MSGTRAVDSGCHGGLVSVAEAFYYNDLVGVGPAVEDDLHDSELSPVEQPWEELHALCYRVADDDGLTEQPHGDFGTKEAS